MEPISILLLAAVLTKMVGTHREDMEYARQGKDSPRYRMKMARAEAARRAGEAGVRAPARPGAKGYFAELWYDAWDDLAAHRQRVRQERRDGVRPTRRQQAAAVSEWAKRSLNRRPDGQPVDDMVDVAGVRPDPARSYDPNNTRNCGVCKGEVVLDGRPCPRCLAEQERRNAEWEREHGEPEWLTPDLDELDEPTTVVHDKPSPPTPPRRIPEPQDAWDRLREGFAAARLLQRPPGITNCDKCGREAHINDLTWMSNGSDMQLWCDRHERPERPKQPEGEVDLTADDVLSNLLGGPAGAGHPRCDRCFKAFTVTADNRTVCGCTNQPDDNTPLATVIPLFPNPKTAEKEISMATSEVNGLSTALAFAEAASNAHQSFATTGAEGYVGALENGGNSGEVLTSAREAMEASGIAADKWAAHQAVLAKQMNIKEGYADNPDAADKGFLLNG
ncbi:hypothetical protein EYA84_01945 [Verrucosispora sp. SN26_14.1]|uniref:hypothetical protein n=1 Tax=Verrucosispora sp. SN26_14.1 TaxID=2527879 RepID=UPI0010331351|nr:hypothetical protein [Verrucosispora sp. SN26_14.1]TBL44227.1 hypothetical protein EYA84_01945 [Verrucosispora sp. SN26_14.1]